MKKVRAQLGRVEFLFFYARHLVGMYRHLLHRWQLLLHIHRQTIRPLHARQLLLHLILFERYTKRDKNLASLFWHVVLAQPHDTRCTNTYATVSCIRASRGHEVVTLRAASTTSIAAALAIFGPVVLSTSLPVIYYSPVIDQCESPWHPCKTRSRNMDALIATMTNYFTTKRPRLNFNGADVRAGLIKIYNERHVTRATCKKNFQ